MEERIIELTAKGHSIGESLDLKIEIGKINSIGSPSEILIEISGNERTMDYDLVPSTSKGFDPDSISLSPENKGSETALFLLNGVPEGKPGPSLLKVILKGDLYSATLAIQEVDFDVRPPSLGVELVDGPIEIRSGEAGILPVKLSMPGKAKIKGNISLNLLDSSGKEMDLKSGGSKHFSFREQKVVHLGFEPGNLPQGTFSVKLEIHGPDLSISRMLTDAVLILSTETGVPDEGSDDLDGLEITNIKLLSYRFDPMEVSPGTETVVTIEIERPELFQEPLDVSLSLGRKKIKDLRIEEGVSQVKERILVPDHIGSGEITSVLTIGSREETLLRKVKPRSILIKGSSRLILSMRTPSDLFMDDQLENEEYLLPGESVRNRRRYGPIEIWVLNSGRYLYLNEGKVVYGNDWEDDMSDRVLNKILSIEIAECFLEPDYQRKLRKEVEVVGAPVSLADHKIDTGGIISEAVIRRHQGKSTQIISRSKMNELHIDPIPSIVNDIGKLMSLEAEVGDLKDHYENMIREFRSMKDGPSRIATIMAHSICVTGIGSALDKLKEQKSTSQGVTELIFFLIASSLVRIECITTWSDPVIGSWDELRVERQRMLKKEISSLFDLIDNLSSVNISVKRRFDSYRSNMTIRRKLEFLSRIRTGGSEWNFEGKGSEIWRGRRTLQFDTAAEGMELVTSVKLPGLSWNLKSPKSVRDASLFIMPVRKVLEGGRFDLELEVASPANPTPSQKGLIYITVAESRLEVEN